MYEFKIENSKPGEKILRSLLRITPEWSNSESRQFAADVAEENGNTEIARTIQNHDIAGLRKRHLLFLCRVWKYKSNLWKPKEALKRELIEQVLMIAIYLERKGRAGIAFHML